MRVWELSKHARDFALDLILMWLVLLLWGLALPVAGLAGLFLWIWRQLLSWKRRFFSKTMFNPLSDLWPD